MILVTLKELKNKFNELINGELSKEEVSNWAIARERANDNDLLEFDPVNYKPVIWDGIDYLTGVDLINPDGSYLHIKEDFIDYRNQLFDDQSSLVKSLFERDAKFREAEKEVVKLEEKYPNQSDQFYMEKTDEILIKKGLVNGSNPGAEK